MGGVEEQRPGPCADRWTENIRYLLRRSAELEDKTQEMKSLFITKEIVLLNILSKLGKNKHKYTHTHHKIYKYTVKKEIFLNFELYMCKKKTKTPSFRKGNESLV